MFVVFEGIDGSGKTTVSNRVAERLRVNGISVKHLRAGGRFASTVSQAIRELGRDARYLDLVPQAEFLLYVARDVQLIEEALRPALDSYDVVITDRFLFTAEVLGGQGRSLPLEWMEPVLRVAAGGLVPDLVVLIDADPVLARARRKSSLLESEDRRAPSRKGLTGQGLQHRLRRGYLERARSGTEHWVVVDNEGDLEDTIDRVSGLIASARALGVREALARFPVRPVQSAQRAWVSAPPSTPEQALHAFLGWLDLRMEREPQVAAYMLGGLSGCHVDDRRRALTDRVPEAVLAALVGLRDEVSFEIRERLVSSHPRAVARTLAGVPDNDIRANALRDRLEPAAPIEVMASLSHSESPRAWALRENLYERDPNAVVESLTGLDAERAWCLRERWMGLHGEQMQHLYELACVACRSVTGLDNARAWQLREQVRGPAPVAALLSLKGLVSAQSWAWRCHSVQRAPKVVMATLRGLSEALAWELRLAVASTCKEAIDSITGMTDEQAWALREAHRDTWPSTVVKSLGPLADIPRGRALLEQQLKAHPDNVSLIKHAAAVALGAHRTNTYTEPFANP